MSGLERRRGRAHTHTRTSTRTHRVAGGVDFFYLDGTNVCISAPTSLKFVSHAAFFSTCMSFKIERV